MRAGNSAAQVSTERNERSPANGRLRVAGELGELAQEPGVDRGGLVDRLDRGAAAEQLEDRLEARRAGVRRGSRAAPRSAVSARLGGLSSSRERSALAKAWPNVRPIAITSPTDFMCVESVAAASGNFSKAKRGHLTTT